jgi:hypothetical protein
MGAVYFIVSKKTGQVALVTLGEKLAQRYLEEDPDLSGFVVMGEEMPEPEARS